MKETEYQNGYEVEIERRPGTRFERWVHIYEMDASRECRRRYESSRSHLCYSNFGARWWIRHTIRQMRKRKAHEEDESRTESFIVRPDEEPRKKSWFTK